MNRIKNNIKILIFKIKNKRKTISYLELIEYKIIK